MMDKTGIRRFYINSLLSSAACVVVFSASCAEVNARGLFAEKSAIPAIEINLDAITNLKLARQAAEVAAAEAEAEARAQAAEMHQKSQTQDELQSEAYSEQQAEVVTSDASDAAEQSRLPIVIKKVEAPIAPMYKREKLVSTPVEGEEENKESRTVASMFRDLFYGDEPHEHVEAVTQDTKTDEIKDDEESLASEMDEADVTEMATLPDAQQSELTPFQQVDEASDDIDDEGAYIQNDNTQSDEPVVNHVDAQPQLEEAKEQDSESFFSKIMDSFKDDKVEKKKAIAIERPETPENLGDVPSIFADSESDFEVIKDGKELLEDGQVEQLVQDENLDSLVENKSEIPEGAQIILPNEVKDVQDSVQISSAFIPQPRIKPGSNIAEKEKVEIASVVSEAIEKAAPKIEETKKEIDSTISDLKDKELPPAPKETNNVVITPKLKVDAEQVPVDLAVVQEQKIPEVIVEEDVVIDNPLLDEPYYIETKPVIPTPADVLERELEQEKELVATPVVIDKKEPKPSFLNKAKNWFGFGDKKDQPEEAVVAVRSPASKLENEIAMEDIEAASSLPAVLPDAVDIKVTEMETESLAPSSKTLPEKFDVIQEDETIEEVELVGVREVEASPTVILPHEIKTKVDEVPKALEEIEETPLKVTSLDTKVEKAIPQTSALIDDSLLSLEFLPAQTEILHDDRAKIMKLVNEIKQDSRKRLKIKSYASQVDDRPGSARRVSLQRAIAIRSVMVESGIEGVRINVQAMGDAVESGEQDRADIQVIQD